MSALEMTEESSKEAPAGVLLRGTPAPPFQLHVTPDQMLSLGELRGKPVILAFYPADWSPVCGDEMTLLNECLSEFRGYGAELLGISVDIIHLDRDVDIKGQACCHLLVYPPIIALTASSVLTTACARNA